MNTLIKAIPPSFPEGYCPATFAEGFMLAISQTQFILQSDVGNSFFNYGPGPISVDNRGFPWFNTTHGRWYNWNPSYGVWTAPYWPPPSPECKCSIDWTGSETDLKNFDNPGGAANPVTAVTGPFWEVDHDFDARIAIGAGTLPSGTLIGVGTNIGAEKIALTINNLPKHRHFITMIDNGSDSYLGSEPAEEGGFRCRGAEDLQFRAAADSGGNLTTVGRTRETGADTALDASQISIMPPVRGVLKAKRTLRRYFAV